MLCSAGHRTGSGSYSLPAAKATRAFYSFSPSIRTAVFRRRRPCPGDGRRRAFGAWKHYRGGDTTPIWLATLSNSKIEKIPRDNSNDYNPLWIGTKVYFLSDRNGAVTLFSYDPRSHQVKEELKNTGLDFKSIGGGTDGIVIEQFGGLSLFDLKTGKAKPVPVTIAGDLPEVRERMVNVSRRLGSAHLSPNAARAVFEARGEILTVPAEKGDVRVITNTPKIMERSPAWSPDGKTIAYFSDEAGEYALHLAQQTGMGEAVKVPMPEAGFYREPVWSPDSQEGRVCGLAYADLVRRRGKQEGSAGG
jgi:tricorn protease